MKSFSVASHSKTSMYVYHHACGMGIAGIPVVLVSSTAPKDPERYEAILRLYQSLTATRLRRSGTVSVRMVSRRIQGNLAGVPDQQYNQPIMSHQSQLHVLSLVSCMVSPMENVHP